MGMGEPLANYRNVINALRIITDGTTGLKISSRRVTLSTAGLVPNMARLGQDILVNLAVSLNATDNKTRDWLMPINRTYPIEKLLEACAAYPLANRRKITFEYILIKGVNDTAEDAGRLAGLLRPIRAKINLIPFNTHAESPFECPDEDVILRFQSILMDKGYTVVIRRSRGGDISAACGQLRARSISNLRSYEITFQKTTSNRISRWLIQGTRLLMPFDLNIFDYDGVLVDSLKA